MCGLAFSSREGLDSFYSGAEAFAFVVVTSLMSAQGMVILNQCINHVFGSYSKTNQMHQCLEFILFWNNTLHVLDGLSVHHQEFTTIHTVTGIRQTDTATAC